MEYVQSNNKDTDVVLVSLLLTYFTPFSSISLVDFEHVNVSGKSVMVQCYIPHRNQSFDLHCKSNDWFLYEMQY